MKQYSTSDIGLVAALKTKAFPIIGNERDTSDGCIFFLFEETAGLRACVHAYYSDELQAPCQQYHYALRSVSSMLKSMKHRF